MCYLRIWGGVFKNELLREVLRWPTDLNFFLPLAQPPTLPHVFQAARAA
jgi:hypothetical protein